LEFGIAFSTSVDEFQILDSRFFNPMRPLVDGLPGALTSLLCNAPLSDGKVAFAWTAAVGGALARATTVKLEHGVLIVETTSAQWSREIQRSSGVILPRLAALLGKDTVRRLEVRT
jgi:predicted nucleic acid-binding Zn ribbon protein